MFKEIVTSADNGYFSSLPAPLIQYSNRHCSHECGAGRPWPGPQPQSCHFHFNLRKKKRNWLGGIYANEEGSEELSGNWVNGCAVLRNESHILLFLSERGSVWSFMPVGD